MVSGIMRWSLNKKVTLTTEIRPDLSTFALDENDGILLESKYHEGLLYCYTS